MHLIPAGFYHAAERLQRSTVYNAYTGFSPRYAAGRAARPGNEIPEILALPAPVDIFNRATAKSRFTQRIASAIYYAPYAAFPINQINKSIIQMGFELLNDTLQAFPGIKTLPKQLVRGTSRTVLFSATHMHKAIAAANVITMVALFALGRLIADRAFTAVGVAGLAFTAYRIIDSRGYTPRKVSLFVERVMPILSDIQSTIMSPMPYKLISLIDLVSLVTSKLSFLSKLPDYWIDYSLRECDAPLIERMDLKHGEIKAILTAKCELVLNQAHLRKSLFEGMSFAEDHHFADLLTLFKEPHFKEDAPLLAKMTTLVAHLSGNYGFRIEGDQEDLEAAIPQAAQILYHLKTLNRTKEQGQNDFDSTIGALLSEIDDGNAGNVREGTRKGAERICQESLQKSDYGFVLKAKLQQKRPEIVQAIVKIHAEKLGYPEEMLKDPANALALQNACSIGFYSASGDEGSRLFKMLRMVDSIQIRLELIAEYRNCLGSIAPNTVIQELGPEKFDLYFASLINTHKTLTQAQKNAILDEYENSKNGITGSIALSNFHNLVYVMRGILKVR